MVTKQTTPIEEQAVAREAVAAAITEAAERVLADWEDDRLLGQPRARTLVQVTRAVRVRVGRNAPDVVARVTSWRLRRLLEEHISRAVSRAQGRALQRRYADEEPGDSQLAFAVGEPINGVTVIGITFPSHKDTDQDEAWSADE